MFKAGIPYILRFMYQHYANRSEDIKMTFALYLLSADKIFTQAYELQELPRVESAVPFYMQNIKYVGHGCILPVTIGQRDALQMTFFCIPNALQR
jgi:hypothetical protein